MLERAQVEREESVSPQGRDAGMSEVFLGQKRSIYKEKAMTDNAWNILLWGCVFLVVSMAAVAVYAVWFS